MQKNLIILLLPLLLACQHPTSKTQQVLFQQNLVQTLTLIENDLEQNMIKIQERAQHKEIWKPILNLSEQSFEVYHSFEKLIDSLKQNTPSSKEAIKGQLKTALTNSTQKLLSLYDTFHSPGFFKYKMKDIPAVRAKLKEEITIYTSLHSLDHANALAYENTLYQLQLEVLQAASKTFNFFNSSFSCCRMTYDRFNVLHHHTAYLQQGDPYQNNIYLGDIHRPQQDQLTINGKSVATKRGKASFQYRPESLADTSFTAVWTFFNVSTNQMDTLSRQFNIKIRHKVKAQIKIEGRNLLAKLIPHPYSISPKLKKNQVIRTSTNLELDQVNNGIGYLSVKPEATVGDKAFVSIEDTLTGKKLEYQKYHIVNMPYPDLKLTNNRDNGFVKAKEMRAQRGLMALILNYDIDLRCQTKQFEFHHFPAKGQPLHVINQGGTFRGATLQAIQVAQPGDSYLFTDVQLRCPGDIKTQTLHSLNFVVE